MTATRSGNGHCPWTAIVYVSHEPHHLVLTATSSPENVFHRFLALKFQSPTADPPDLARLIGITAQNHTEISAYLWDTLLASVVQATYLEIRQLADLYSNSAESLETLSTAWPVMESLLAQLDTLTMTVTLYNSYTEPGADSQAVLAVLRSIGCVELCLLQNVVYALLIARRLNSGMGFDESSGSEVPKWTTSVVQRMLRIYDVVMVRCLVSFRLTVDARMPHLAGLSRSPDGRQGHGSGSQVSHARCSMPR